jgi:RNA polymerase sigma-32 factor
LIDERSCYVLESRWLNEEKIKILHELVDELGVSAERIRQIEQNALKKLKSLM